MYLRIVLTVTLTAIFTSFAFAQSNWSFLNPQPTGSTLRDVISTDANTLWTIGDEGILLVSNDDGENWAARELPTNAHLFAITFHARRGCIVGAEGTILVSDDFGESWQLRNFGTSKTLLRAEFIDENTGWVLAADSLLLQTTDGGHSWQADTLEHDFITGTFSLALNDLEFVSPNVGWLAVGYYRQPNLDINPESRGALLKTADGGKTWAIVDSGDTKFTSIHFLNHLTGWITTNNVDSGRAVLRTDDGGETWTKHGVAFDWQKMYFHNSRHGWGTYYTYIGRTIDGGATWSIDRYMDPPSPESGFKGLVFRNETDGWVVGFHTWHQ